MPQSQTCCLIHCKKCTCKLTPKSGDSLFWCKLTLTFLLKQRETNVAPVINDKRFFVIIQALLWLTYERLNITCADPEWGQGVRTPLEYYKNIGFLSNTGPDPLQITKLPSKHSMLCHYRPASETPFKWRFAGGAVDGPLIVVFGSFLPSSSLKKRCQSWTPLRQNFLDPRMHKRAWMVYV